MKIYHILERYKDDDIVEYYYIPYCLLGSLSGFRSKIDGLKFVLSSYFNENKAKKRVDSLNKNK